MRTARPGIHITGFTTSEPTTGGKWAQVLKEIAPNTTHATVIFNPDTAPYYPLYLSSIEDAGASLAMKIIKAPVHSRAEIESAISEVAREPDGAVISMSDTFVTVHRDLIMALAASYRLPAVYPFPFEIEEGALLAYGVDLSEINHQAASYVDRILKGEKAADCPSSKFLRQRAVPIKGGSGSSGLMMLRGLLLVPQAALCDGLAFDPFSVQQDCLAASEVNVGRG